MSRMLFHSTHRLSAESDGADRRTLSTVFSIRSMAKAIASFTVAICLAVTAAGGTYALLNSSAPVSPVATITSGTAALTVSTLSLSTAGMYPGLTVYGPVMVNNTGDVPLTMRVTALTPPTASTTFSQSLTIGVAVVASLAACTTGVVPTWTGTFAAAAAGVIGSTLAVGGSAILCVTVTLPLAAPAGSQSQSATNFGLQINGTQV